MEFELTPEMLPILFEDVKRGDLDSALGEIGNGFPLLLQGFFPV